MIVVALSAATALGQPRYSRAQVQGALLGQILRFIEWPAGRGHSELRVAVLGNGPLRDALPAILQRGGSAGRPVAVRLVDDLESVGVTDVLVVTGAPRVQLEAAVARFATDPVLVVTDASCGCDRGASVHFFVDDDNVRFEINRVKLRRIGLVPSYHLLRYAASQWGCD